MAYTNPSITASGTTFAQFQAAGASGHLERLIAAQVVTLAPTVAATWTATGGGATGGALAAGTFYMVVTESNGIGETLAGPESAQITVGATNIPRITFQTLKTGNLSRNVYIGAVNGSTGGPYKLYGTGITAATYDLSVAAPVSSYAGNPPTANSTGLVLPASGAQNESLEMLRGAKTGNLQDAYHRLSRAVKNFNGGEAQSFSNVIADLRMSHTVFASLATLCAEMGVLIDANPGTIRPVATPIGTWLQKRTWP
jgi:hypothetical protein